METIESWNISANPFERGELVSTATRQNRESFEADIPASHDPPLLFSIHSSNSTLWRCRETLRHSC